MARDVRISPLEDRLLLAVDFGDASDALAGTGNYKTRDADGGPKHTIVAGIRLGASVDGEPDAAPTARANGDDVNLALPIDEDGVISRQTELIVTAGTVPTITLRATNTSGLARGTFNFTVNDAGLGIVSAPLTINVTAVADIVPDSLTANEDTALIANLITGTNGASADNFEGTPTLTSVTAATHGGATETAIVSINVVAGAELSIVATAVTRSSVVPVTISSLARMATTPSPAAAAAVSTTPATSSPTLRSTSGKHSCSCSPTERSSSRCKSAGCFAWNAIGQSVEVARCECAKFYFA